MSLRGKRRHQPVGGIDLGKGSLGPSGISEIISHGKCHLCQAISQHLSSDMSQASFFSFCDSECFPTTHAVNRLKPHHPRAFPTSYWGHGPRWESLLVDQEQYSHPHKVGIMCVLFFMVSYWHQCEWSSVKGGHVVLQIHATDHVPGWKSSTWLTANSVLTALCTT